jgi:TIR domain
MIECTDHDEHGERKCYAVAIGCADMSNGHIFISYRREDSAGYTRAIYNGLAQHFSKEGIFMDVDAIEPGVPFDEAIRQAVGQCDVLLAVIGRHWMDRQEGVGPRINDPKDFVRLEISTALSRDVRVIPVLLDGASMPSEEALPEPLRLLARRHAVEISNSRFNSDMERLVTSIRKVFKESNRPTRKQRLRGYRSILYWLAGGLVVVFSIVYFYFFLMQPKPPPNAGVLAFVYTITPDGTLRWYRHDGAEFSGGLNAWQGPHDISSGWGNFRQVFPSSEGIIYAIAQDGTLWWYKHNGYLDGGDLKSPGAWEGPKEVGIKDQRAHLNRNLRL